jgi:hypothetical protein
MNRATVDFMKHISAHTLGGGALLLFIVVALIVPEPEKLQAVSVLFGAVTFVFATMSGFFLTRLNHRFDTVRNEISAEDADFLSLYYYSTVIGGKVEEHVRKTIDDYYLTTFETKLSTYHKPTRDEYKALYQIFTLPRGTEVRYELQAVYQNVLLTDIERHRNVIARASEEKLTKSMWSIVYTLALLVIVSIFLLRDATFFFDLAAVLLSTTVVVIVALMRDLEVFKLGGVPLAAESGYEMFDAMGLPRYIQEDKLKSGKVKIPKGVTEVRIGHIDPATGERVLKTVEVSSLPPELRG